MTVFLNINKFLACLHLPLFILLFLLLWILISRKKILYYYLTATILFLFIWRSFISAYSTRYYSVFLIAFVVLFAFAYKELSYDKSHTKIRSFISLLLIFAFFYNTIKNFSGFPNNYLFDINDTFQRNERIKDYFYALIPTNEYKRVGANVSNKFDYEIPLNDLTKEYSLWGEDLYILSLDNHIDSYKQIESNIKIVQKHKRNSHSKAAYLYLFSPPRHQLSSENIPEGQNLILNGDIERVQDQQKTNKVLKSWIDAGDRYYDSPQKRLPEHQILLPHWTPFEPDFFPAVYVDDTDPINGKYSLRICNGEKNNHIFFLNEIKSVPGCFSFLVKNMGNKSIFNIRRYEYRSDVEGPITPKDSNRYVLLHNENTYRLAIEIKENDLIGTRSLFFIAGTNYAILVDDIVYSPQN